jgi:hypothetical protein
MHGVCPFTAARWVDVRVRLELTQHGILEELLERNDVAITAASENPIVKSGGRTEGPV